MNRIKMLLVVGLVVFGLIGCGDKGNSVINNDSGLNKIYAEHTAPASKLFEGKWKLAGVVDVKTGSLQELEPKDCEECYTMTFDTDTTFSSFSTSNHGTGTYNYGTHNFRITGHGGTEIGERGDGNLWVSTLWAVESFSLLENELRMYYDGGKKYLLYNPKGTKQDGTPVVYDIKNIFAGSYAMQFVVGEYKIDFENKKFWKYPDSGWTFDRRDATAENEGFTFVSNLSDEKIKVFFEQASTYGLTSWEDEYVEPLIMDGHHWRVVITYANDSTKAIYGSNKYPDTYDNMREAFKNLTGETVLKK